MKYRLLRPLPFMSAGVVFGSGCWAGGGWGVDRGYDKNGAHNGVETFREHEDTLLSSLIPRADWVEPIPERVSDLFELLDNLQITRLEFEMRVDMK